MDAATREAVANRANRRCEYCHLPEFADPHSAFHLEHVIPRQHGGADLLENLAWSCSRCNRRKGPNLASIDPISGAVCELFHPRRENWSEHFTLQDARIFGLSEVGRATARLLDMNSHHRVQLRRELLAEGKFTA
jgi:hypothetical protein